MRTNKTIQLKHNLYNLINQLSRKYNKKISKKMGMYRRYWDNIIGDDCSDSLDRLLTKEIQKIKNLSRKEFGMCFGKKPLNQRRKGSMYGNETYKWKSLKNVKKVLGM